MSKFPFFAATAMILIALISFLRSDEVEAAGTIAGTVYIDHNMNGARNTSGAAPDLAVDTGVSGVTVTVFATNGLSKTATTDASGTYSINTASAPALPIGPYRIEFTSLPNGYSPSIVGSNNGTTVRYLPDGNGSNVDLGIISNPDYCQNTPNVYLPVANFGQQTSSEPGLIRFPFNAGASFTDTDALATSDEDSNYAQPNRTAILSANQIGTTWGLAYQRDSGRLFVAAHFKRHFGFLTNTATAAAQIYVTNPATSSVVTSYTVPGISNNSHLAGSSTYERDGNNAGWDAVGKQSLGGIDISDDDRTLYAMNLQDRTLYSMNADTGTVIASALTTGLTMPTPGGSATNCPLANKRPFAVKYHQGLVYIGMVCSGETGTQNATNLRAYVFTADPTTLAINATPVVNIPLNYTRGYVTTFGRSDSAAWRPWRATYASQAGTSGEISYPQPILKGITFQNSNMILGVADRFGDQVGFQTPSNPSSNNLLIANSAGDTLKLCGSPGSGWTLESNGRCGSQGTAPQGSNHGPGGGEFFFQDVFADVSGGHEEVTTGGLDTIPGTQQIVSTVYDPVNQNTVTSPINWAFTQGIRFLNATTGATDRAYYINRAFYSKGNDLGQVVVACEPAPLQIGNRVWLDSDRDGVQDPNETPIAGVSVQLYVDSTGDGEPDLLAGNAVTDVAGQYLFGGPNNTSMLNGHSVLPNTAYEVRIPSSNFNTPSGPLAFLLPSPGGADISANGISRDSNGTAFSNYVRARLTTGGYSKNDHTIDFGFMLPPTSAGIIVAGRVIDEFGRGIPRTSVTVTDPQTSEVVFVNTNSFGYFSFSELEAGRGYIVSVSAKAYSFDPDVRFIKAYSSINDMEFRSLSRAQKNAKSK